MSLVGGITGKSTTERLISLLSPQNAKRLAVILVIGFIGYHGLLHLQYGSDSCNWLLWSGRYKADHEWQPYGCMLHRYSQADTRHCLRHLAFWGKYNKFSFVGDEGLRQLYDYFIGTLRARRADATGSRLQNNSYTDDKLKLRVEFIPTPDVSRAMVDQFRTWESCDSPPTVIVASCGLSGVLRHNRTAEAHVQQFSRNLTLLIQPAEALAARGTVVLWRLLQPAAQRDVDVRLYNNAAYQMLTHSSIKLWNSERLTASGAPGAGGAGAQLSRTALRHDAQILLNLYCNQHMNFNDGSCCAAPQHYTAMQAVAGALFLVCIVVVVTKSVYSWIRTKRLHSEGYTAVPRQPSREPAPVSPVAALARLALIVAYFFLCDRTNFFMKENKYYSEWSFWLPVGYVLALGLFFTEDSKSTEVLHRQQTDEWKGWMQLIVLVYHVTGASKVLPIYMLVRAIVSAYLFITGYGHICYIWRTGDTGLVRYLRVIFRLNFVTVVLCLTMNRSYQFYNFVPLVTFWFTLTFLVLALPPHITPASSHTAETRPYQYAYLALKMIGLLAIVTVLYMSEVFFLKIFVSGPWRALFANADGDIHEWWLRWKQDRYSVTYGMIAGAVVCVSRRHGWLEDATRRELAAARGALLACACAALALCVYAGFTFLCRSAAECDEIHSYVAFVPVLAYVVLRNAAGGLRARHSSLFAWVGNMSLELFASQSHIWLAADTHGVLVLLPGAPALNLILTSYVFVCAAHELRKLTETLAVAAVPSDWRLALRNAGLLLAVLVPVGLHDGLF